MNLVFEAMYKGLALGMALCISIGPSFFALIQTSIKNGYRSGIALAIGVFLSDVFCVAVAYLGASQLFEDPKNKLYIGLIGGTILMVFGIFNIFQKKAIAEENMEIKEVNQTLIVLKGFVLNTFNPFVLLLWIAWMGLISSQSDFTAVHVILFFVTALATVLATDILKALAANKIARFLTPALLLWVNRIVGIIMIVCGLSLIYRVF